MIYLASNIKRKRLLIEGFYDKIFDNEMIEEYIEKIIGELGFELQGKPVAANVDKQEPYTLFVSLAQLGIAFYVWKNSEFISVLLHSSCDFDEDKAVEITKEFFNFREIEYESF